MARVHLHPPTHRVYETKSRTRHCVWTSHATQSRGCLEEMWAEFAWGCTVPDPFRCLFQTIGLAFTPYEAHITMCGYGLTHQITIQLTDVFNQDAINTFLITLTTFNCSLRLTAGWDNLWSILLACESNCPIDNWNKLCSFMNIDTYLQEDFGLSFTAPPDTSQPWEICTCWRQDDFMQVLLAVRPSLQNLQLLLTFANVFVWTQPVDQPLSGTLVGQNHEQMYTMLFIHGPEILDMFIVNNMSKTEEAAGEMEVDKPLCHHRKANTMFTSLALLVVSHLSSGQHVHIPFPIIFFLLHPPPRLTSKNSLACDKLSYWVLMLPRQSARCNGAHTPFNFFSFHISSWEI